MTKTIRRETNFGNIKNWIIGVTSVLIAAPALINAAIDIVVHVKKLPRTQAESNNLEMFKKHWGKDALGGGAVPVKTSLGVVELEFRVYDGGDIFTKYGNNSKWFPSPLKRPTKTGLLVTPAYAGALPKPAGQQFQANTPVRGRFTAEIVNPTSKTRKVYKVDPLTGNWNAAGSRGLPASTSRGLPSFKYRTFPKIDLTKK